MGKSGIRRDIAVVLVVQAAAIVAVAGWFATGHAAAPDHGLVQLDVLSLSERVEGATAVDGRPTLLVLTCDRLQAPPPPGRSPAYRLQISTDPALAERLALPLAVSACQSGYVLLDGSSRVRYRTYDPGWRSHGFEQEVLLEHLADHE